MKVYIILKQEGLFVTVTLSEDEAIQIKQNINLDLGLGGHSDCRVWIEEKTI